MKWRYIMIKKLCIYLLLLFFVITTVLLGRYYYLCHTLIPQYQKKLSVIAQQRTQEINDFLKQQEKNAEELSSQPLVIDILATLNKKNTLSEQDTSLSAFLASVK